MVAGKGAFFSMVHSQAIRLLEHGTKLTLSVEL